MSILHDHPYRVHIGQDETALQEWHELGQAEPWFADLDRAAVESDPCPECGGEGVDGGPCPCCGIAF